MISYKSLDQLVLQLIKTYATEKQSNASMSSQYSSDILPYTANKNVSSDETSEIVRALVDSLNKLVQPYIDKGLEVTASNPPDEYINISSGAGIVSGHYIETDESMKLRVPLDSRTNTFYINFDGTQITIEPHKYEAKLPLAKIVVPRPGTSVAIEDDQPSDKSNLNAWIVSGKDILFDGKWTFDDDSLAILGNKLGYILARNVFGELNLSENLKIKNTQGTLKADSKSLSFYYENDIKASEFNRQGVYFYNTAGYELAKFTSNEARIGNIVIEPNKLRSGNFSAGNLGFCINDDGTSEFSDVTVRGTIYASLGEIGGWSIDSNKIYSTTTGAGILQGGTIRTSANVGMGDNGIIMDLAGLRGYSSVLGQTFNIPTDGSAPTFASGIINDTIFNINTNAVLRTSETVGDGTALSYGILINNTGIYGCSANQLLSDANFKLLAADGSAIFKGTIISTSGMIGGFTISNDTLVGGTIQGARIYGSTIETVSASKPIRIDNNGIQLLMSGAGVVSYYGGGALYGDGTKYGTGQLAVINSPTLRVPFYIVNEQTVADFHFIDRDVDPTSTAEVGDVCCVNGKMRICTTAGTPGTFIDIGGIEVRTSDPTSPTIGQMWLRSDLT